MTDAERLAVLEQQVVELTLDSQFAFLTTGVLTLAILDRSHDWQTALRAISKNVEAAIEAFQFAAANPAQDALAREKLQMRADALLAMVHKTYAASLRPPDADGQP